MRCKTCDYPLWQLTSRQCPECGTPFKPSEFEFTLNSVRFCCPYCQQAYYGTGDKGQLVPRTFACVSCGQTIDMDEMVLLPTEGVTEKQTEVTIVPWVNRHNRGWFTSFFITMGMAMGNPNRTIEAVPEGSSAGRAIAYMCIHVIPQSVLSGLPFFFWMILLTATLSTGRGSAVGMIAAFVATAAVAPLAVIAWACLVHGLLRLTGPTPLGFKRTLHAICYSSGNNFICAVPCLGFYFCWVGAIWWTLSSAFMLAKAHGARAWRVWIAVGAPVLLALLLGVGGIVAMFFGVQRSVSSAMASMPGMPSAHPTNAAAGQRLAGVLAATTPLPAHPAELILDHRIMPEEMLLPGDASDTRSCSVQHMSLSQLGSTFGSQQRVFRQRLPADPALGGPACRVGDFVFAYIGMPSPPPDANLWLAIGWPDPSLNKKDPKEVVLVQPGGASSVVSTSGFDQILSDQNDLRAKLGLAPIPHPRQVVATSVKVAPPSYMRGPAAAPSGANVATVLSALRNASPPVKHAAELLASDAISPTDLVETNAPGQSENFETRMESMPVGTSNLSDWDSLMMREKRRAAQAAAAWLPPNTVAYRLGDMVFTHPGIDLTAGAADPEAGKLWLIVEAPEPEAGSETGNTQSVLVGGETRYAGRADGTVESFAGENFAQTLADQNALRAKFGLPPLPDPVTVTRKKPATAASPPKMTVPPPDGTDGKPPTP